ncbi:MAG TPA: HNH endonuclease [Bacteroidales bacterium]|jgi:5-methylcytosine-specific restriction endonuclease McrA|nr:HNH endonuclease [Bacteroidales bacterium]
MRDIAHKAIVLKLNKLWRPVGVELVSKTICDLITGVIEAIDIVYSVNQDGTPNFNDEYEYVNPVTWEEWIKLPVRPWDLSIHSAHMHIRVPTVVVTKNYSKIPVKKFRGKPTKEGLFIRDNGTDAYNGKDLEFEEATIDHVIPLSRGGTDTYDNTVLTDKETNNKKGNKLNHEVGLKLLFKPAQPKTILVSHTIRKARHQDWKFFLEKPKV